MNKAASRAQRVLGSNTLRNKTYYLENVKKGLLTHPSQVYWVNEPASTETFIKKIDHTFQWVDSTNKLDESRATNVDRTSEELAQFIKENLVAKVPSDVSEYLDIIATEYLDLTPEKKAYYLSMDYTGEKNFITYDKEGTMTVDWEKFVSLVAKSSEERTKLQRAPKAARETEKIQFKLDHRETPEEVEAKKPNFEELRKQVPSHYVDQLEQDLNFLTANLPEVDASFIDHIKKYNAKVGQKALNNAHDLLPQVYMESHDLSTLFEVLRTDPAKESLPVHDFQDPFFVEEFLPDIVDQTILEIEYDNWDVEYAEDIRRVRKPIEEYLATYDAAGVNAIVNKFFNEEKNENALAGGLSEREIFEKRLFKRVQDLIESNKNLIAEIAGLKQEGAQAKVEESTDETVEAAQEKDKLTDQEFWTWTSTHLNFEKDLYDDFAERGEEAVKEFVAKKKAALEAEAH